MPVNLKRTPCVIAGNNEREREREREMESEEGRGD